MEPKERIVRGMTRFSITVVATDRGPGIVDVARLAENVGLDGLWIPDHTHVADRPGHADATRWGPS